MNYSKKFESIKDLLKKTYLRFAFIYFKKFFANPRSQNNEDQIINKIIKTYEIPKTFIELGYSGWEFNCCKLAKNWTGLLVDGNQYNIDISKILWSKNITSKKLWITRTSCNDIINWLNEKDLGILSIDLDGNDYWIMEKLIELNPSVLISEYNAVLGLKSISVPYDKEFEREKKHNSKNYYGASITALSNLAKKNGYSLLDISNNGINLFFIRNDLLNGSENILNPETSFKEKIFNNGKKSSDYWFEISKMPFIQIDNE